VLGLAPLLYEQSSQAQFLRPTVITLVYGLGFGMVLVLMIVPALLAVQDDIGRLVRSWRRGIRTTRAGGLRAGTLVATTAMILWLGATMGWTLWSGAMPAALAGLMPVSSPMLAALILFILGAAVISLLAYALMAVPLAMARRRHIQS